MRIHGTVGLVALGLIVAVSTRASAQGTWRVSVPTNPGNGTLGSQSQADGMSYPSAISPDGRFLAFFSRARNLVSGDTNRRWDVFVRDREMATTTRVSVNSLGEEGDDSSTSPSISPDGRFVAFVSLAENLVPGDTNHAGDVFVHDSGTATTTRVSVSSTGSGGNYDSGAASISADGRFVAFESVATNLVSGDTNLTADVFVHDRQTASTTRVSVGAAGVEGNGDSHLGAMSADGRFVAFYSFAKNLVAGDTNRSGDVFVHDRQTATTTRVSVDSAGVQGNADSYSFSISADGRFVAITSVASNLVPGDLNGLIDVFVHDRQTATTTRASVDSAGLQGNGYSTSASVSADGRFVAFTSVATNFVAGDTNGESDVFVHDFQTGTTTRVSVSASGTEANHRSTQSLISADGRFTTFLSIATNLVPGDTGIWDVYVHGPYLTLSAESESVAAGDVLSLATWSGQPGGLAVLSVVEVNGTPVSGPMTSGSFDVIGRWSVDRPVPPGLSGFVVTFRAQGITTIGTVETTNRETVTFQ